MSAENVETVRRLFEAVEARDLPSYLAVYDPAVVIREASFLPYGGTYHRHEGAKEHGTGFASVWGKFQPADEKRLDPVFLDAGDRVVLLFRLKGLAGRERKKARRASRFCPNLSNPVRCGAAHFSIGF
jgi:hypothetical protein